jgi:hypothetical protein
MCDFLSGTVMRASFSLASPSLVDASVKLADGLFEKMKSKGSAWIFVFSPLEMNWTSIQIQPINSKRPQLWDFCLDFTCIR